MAKQLTAVGPDAQPDFAGTLQSSVRPAYPAIPWYTDWGNLALLGLLPFVGIYLLWIAFEWGSERTALVIYETGFLPVMLLGVIFAWRAAQLVRDDPRTHRAWSLIGIGFLVWLIGDAIWAYDVITAAELPLMSLVSVSYIVAMSAIVTGVLTFPYIGIADAGRRVFLLDSSIILVGVISLIAFFIIGPDQLLYSSIGVEAFGMFAYSVATAAGLLGVYYAVVRRSAAGAGAPLLFIAMGLSVVGIPNLGWVYYEVRGVSVSGGLIFAAWMVGQTLLIASPQVYHDLVRRQLTYPAISSLIERSYTFVPYVATAVGTIMLMSTGVYILIDRMGIIILLVILLIGLIVTRQIVALRQNARLLAAQAVRDTENWFRTLVMHSSDMVTVIDRETRCSYQSPSATDVTRYLPRAPVGSRFLDWVHPEDRHNVWNVINEALALEAGSSATMNVLKVEWRLDTGDDVPVHFETIISNRINDPTVRGLVLNSRDITERKQLEAQLTFQAFHDPLTNLPNRAMFFRKLDQVLRHAGAQRGVALLFVDIDNFKQINDRHGHDIGDQLLQQFGRRLQGALRSEDTVSRLAGDEFTVLLTDIQNPDVARTTANRILEQLREPFRVAGYQVRVTSSVGISCTESPQSAPLELLRRADSAMYFAKRNGHGRAEMYQPWMDA